MKTLIAILSLTILSHTVQASDWISHTSVDEMDDSITNIMYTEAGEALLVVRCKGDDVNAFISWGAFNYVNFSNKTSKMLVRFDKGEVFKINVVSQIKSTFLRGDIDNFVVGMKKATNVTVRIYGRKTFTETFSLIGFTQAYNKGNCGK